jgi:hypothetical protein
VVLSQFIFWYQLWRVMAWCWIWRGLGAGALSSGMLGKAGILGDAIGIATEREREGSTFTWNTGAVSSYIYYYLSKHCLIWQVIQHAVPSVDA